MKEELFTCNVTSVVKLARLCAKYCPDAFLIVATNPVNCMVPVVASITYNDHCTSKVMGLCSASAMRARSIVAKCLGLDPKNIDVPVYGGHSDNTITPFISQMKPTTKIDRVRQKFYY